MATTWNSPTGIVVIPLSCHDSFVLLMSRLLQVFVGWTLLLKSGMLCENDTIRATFFASWIFKKKFMLFVNVISVSQCISLSCRIFGKNQISFVLCFRVLRRSVLAFFFLLFVHFIMVIAYLLTKLLAPGTFQCLVSKLGIINIYSRLGMLTPIFLS